MQVAAETPSKDPLYIRLLLASHLAQYLRTQLEKEKGYTATVGISTNKLLSKLVGNLHKPDGQTTLLPPYISTHDDDSQDNVTLFISSYEVGLIPGIGFKIAQKLRAHVLQRPAEINTGLVYGGTKENVLVRDVLEYPGIGPDVLERILGGPGTPRGIGARVWSLLNGCDDTPVGEARDIPRQISLEDSYIRLDTIEQVTKELRMLANSLLLRMHLDLLEDEEDVKHDPTDPQIHTKRWLAHPRTIRLSTRPRPPQNPDGSRNRSFARISKSGPMPTFVFNLKEPVDVIVDRLVTETLLPLFRKLHPERNGWNLSLVNVAATNMAEAASEKGGIGRDISKMFRNQDDTLKQWRVQDEEDDTSIPPLDISEQADDPSPPVAPQFPDQRMGSEDIPTSSQQEDLVMEDRWESDGESDVDTYRCERCDAVFPVFAIGAHERWHLQG